ncbi:MAG: DUF882 domain-containing protein [Hyphomicrobiaceae bacterium]|nr:DUF882 domain-containing protein [Hyphomicrobiaceae bacterium]
MQSIFRSAALSLASLALAAALIAAATASRATAAGPRDRTISFFTVNAKESLTVQYMRDGKRIPEAMEKINWILRDWRRDEKTTMDPDLIDLVWEIHHELGSKEPIHVISAYRSRATNDMLRRTIGGQASESRHIQGKAMDVMFPDVPLKRLRYAGLVHERGGVGYYPTSHIPFVHIDVDRVRAWPRATRQELALLFPSGRTQHLPADGSPITPADVRVAMGNRELAAEMSEFHRLIKAEKPPVQYASLMPSLPQLPRLLSAPAPAARPNGAMGLGTRPSDQDRARLAALASDAAPAAAPPRLVASPRPAERNVVQEASLRVPTPVPAPRAAARAGVVLPPAPVFVAQPAFDDEHFEELSFNVFPAAPLLTPTSSRDDPVLVRLVHPFAQELNGEMSIASFIEGEAEAAQNLSALPNRRVASRAR